MYYDDKMYEEMDELMDWTIRETLHYTWCFVRMLLLAIILTALYIVMTPIRIYQYIREIIYLERVSQAEEQVRFDEMRRNLR